MAALALAVAVKASQCGREGIAFTGTAVAIAAATAWLFVAVYPDVLLSSVSTGLTVSNASATAKTLAMMTVVAAIFLPLLLYRGWKCRVFRKRIGTGDIAGPLAPFGRPERRHRSGGQIEPAR